MWDKNNRLVIRFIKKNKEFFEIISKRKIMRL